MNDERPIEKLLRRAAKKRGAEAGPPPELHPANRRVLQAEVARQFPKPDAPAPSAIAEFWTVLTRRWVYAVGVVAVVWVAALAIVPTLSKSKTKSQTNLARSAPSEDRLNMETARNAPAAPEPVAAAATVAMESDSGRILNDNRGGNVKIVPDTAAAPPVVAAPGARLNRETAIRRDAKDASATLADAVVASGGGNLASQPANFGLKAEEKMVANTLGANRREFDSLGTVTVAKSAIALAETSADGLADKARMARGADHERERAVLNSQAYSNVRPESWPAGKKDAPSFRAAPPVLANFKIEQSGRQLQVIDGDGSVYRGVVDEENTLYQQIVEQQNQKLAVANENKFKFQSPKVADAIGAAKPQAADYYHYRVEGTNRSLNQNVVFTWNFVDSNALAAGNLNYQAVAQKLDATKLPSQFPALLQNSFINGRAQFGAGREIEVNAMPVKP